MLIDFKERGRRERERETSVWEKHCLAAPTPCRSPDQGPHELVTLWCRGQCCQQPSDPSRARNGFQIVVMIKLHMKIFPSNAMIQIKPTVANFSYQYSCDCITTHITKPVKLSIRTTPIKADFTQTHFKWRSLLLQKKDNTTLNERYT